MSREGVVVDADAQLWDAARIAEEFGARVNTVQASWRGATLRAVREHLAQFLADDRCAVAGHEVLSAVGPVERLTAGRWQRVCRELGIPALRWPPRALPLPDLVIGNHPGWTEETIRGWARAEGMVDADGALVGPRRGRPGHRRAA